jgi:hypothetical protein
MTDLIIFALAALLLISASICAIIAWQREGRAEAIHATQHTTAAQVGELYERALAGNPPFGAAVEISGIIECDAPLISPRTSTACVAYRYVTEQEYEREYRTRGFGGYGRRTHEIEFEGSDREQRHVPRFWVRDESGQVLIDPTGAHFDLQPTEQCLEMFTDGLGGEREAWHYEFCLPVGKPIYVLGYLTKEQNGPLIARHPLDTNKPFLLSYRDEQSLQGSVRVGAYGLYLAAALSGGGGVLLVLFGLL